MRKERQGELKAFVGEGEENGEITQNRKDGATVAAGLANAKTVAK